MKCTETYKMTLFEMPLDSLKHLAIDIKAQVNMGLMTDKEGSDRLNAITAVMLAREVNDEKSH